MSTVVLLDVSLGMLTPVNGSTESSSKPVGVSSTSAPDAFPPPVLKPMLNRKKLASFGIMQLLEYIKTHARFENVALATYSSSAEMVVGFTRDTQSVTNALQSSQCEPRNRSCLLPALNLLLKLITSTWGPQYLTQVIVITTGQCREMLTPGALEEILTLFPVSSTFVHFVCLAPPATIDTHFFQQVLQANHQSEGLHCLSSVTLNAVQDVFTSIAHNYYGQFVATLRCGLLKAQVQLFPRPSPHRIRPDAENASTVSRALEVVGFLNPQELSNAPVLSQHLVLARPPPSVPEAAEKTWENICLLLHGALKVEDLMGLCRVAVDWFGVIHHIGDSKRSNLMLSLLEPGPCSVPWLGNFGDLRFKPFLQNPEDSKSKSLFPLVSKARPSYGQPLTCWIQSHGLQMDVQKLIRYARKLPDKDVQFFAELNRICNYALAIGCTPIFPLMASFLEKEKATLQSPLAGKQISHVIEMLQSGGNLVYGEPIRPPTQGSAMR